MNKALVFLFALFCLTTAAFAEDTPKKDAPKAEWGYTGGSAPRHWGDLGEAYQLCLSGTHQSPVNIAHYAQGNLPDIGLSYKAAPLTLFNNGHTVQAHYAPGSVMTIDGKTYNLLRTDFRTPSEHYMDGAPYPLEAQFIHQAEDGTMAVLAVVMKLGAPNTAFEKILDNIPPPNAQSATGNQLSAAELMPAALDYYEYDGSLTMPPCTEGVKWHILKMPVELSQEQLVEFQNIFPLNARPVQALNGRIIKGD